MKKLICILLSLLICIGLCGCNILNFEDTESTPNSQPTEAETNSDTEVETKGTAESETEITTETKSETEKETEIITEFETEITTETKVQTETEETTIATSEESSEIINVCEHNWEQIENLDEYTAMDKCSICGDTRTYTDLDDETSLIMWRYNWDGWGVSGKHIYSSKLGDDILESVLNLEETGEAIPKISDDIIVMDDIYLSYIPTERGTVWIDCGRVGLFRLDPSMTEICRVETHLGGGVVLEMTETLKELLRQAWYYAPYDYWDGTYSNGEVTLNRVYNGDSAIEWVEIESIHIENAYHTESNKIVFKLKSSENKMVRYHFESYHSSDNFASKKSGYIELIKDEEVTLEISFAGFVDTRYWISLVIDNTSINLTIE